MQQVQGVLHLMKMKGCGLYWMKSWVKNNSSYSSKLPSLMATCMNFCAQQDTLVTQQDIIVTLQDILVIQGRKNIYQRCYTFINSLEY